MVSALFGTGLDGVSSYERDVKGLRKQDLMLPHSLSDAK